MNAAKAAQVAVAMAMAEAAAPAAPVNVVNRFQSLGPISTPKPYSSSLASQPKPIDPLDHCGPSNIAIPYPIFK